MAHHYSAGWSNLVARQAHNLKVVGSNPAPATKTLYNRRGGIAQAVEQWTENPRVASSTLAPTTTILKIGKLINCFLFLFCISMCIDLSCRYVFMT